MNWAALQKEWGAVTFVLTVLVGMIVVPLALYFANLTPGTTATLPSVTASSARATSARIPSPTPTPSASPSASPHASASPTH